MSIIKIKDTKLPIKEKEIEIPVVIDPVEPTDEQEMVPAIDETVFYYVKDKYCYLINWKWIVPFKYTIKDEETGEEHTYTFTDEQYKECSINNHAPVDYPYADIKDYEYYGLIDYNLTQSANSVARFIEANNFSPDDEISFDELRVFRTWLAETLLSVLVDDKSYEITEMLNYYAKNMYDSTVEHLIKFVPKSEVDILNTTIKNTCGCQNQNQNINLIGSVTSCNALSLYQKAVYEKMVEVFSDISFWIEIPTEFLEEIKKYIDGIINRNLPLYTTEYVSDLYDCSCLSDADASQERLMGYLRNLSKAFGYMIEENIQGKRNFIGDALTNWAAYLYEKMYWV